MGRSLIIGCGYVGQALSSSLTKDKHDVWTISRRNQPHLPNQISITKDWHECTKDDIPDVDFIFYLLSPDRGDLNSYQKTYVDGIHRLLNILDQKKKKPCKIILASSTSVYGVHDGSWVNEETPTSPQTESSKLIVEGEKILIESSYDFCIVRFGGIYGPNRHQLFNQIRQGDVYVQGDQAYSNRIHRDDCVGILKHLMTLVYNEGIYIGVDPEPSPVDEIISWLSAKLGIPIPAISEKKKNQSPSRLTNKRCSCERLLHSGYQFQYSNFREGFNAIIREEL